MTTRVASGLSIQVGRPRPFPEHLGLTKEHALSARREADRAESRGNFARAVELWTLALTIEPNVPAAWQGLARGLRALGRAHDARQIERLPRTLETLS